MMIGDSKHIVIECLNVTILKYLQSQLSLSPIIAHNFKVMENSIYVNTNFAVYVNFSLVTDILVHEKLKGTITMHVS